MKQGQPYVGAKIGHRQYGKGVLRGWNPETQTGAGVFYSVEAGADIWIIVEFSSFGELWWLLPHGGSSTLVPAPPPPYPCHRLMKKKKTLPSVWNIPTRYTFRISGGVEIDFEVQPQPTVAGTIARAKDCGKTIWFFLVNPHVPESYAAIVLALGAESAQALRQWREENDLDRLSGLLLDAQGNRLAHAAAGDASCANIHLADIPKIAKRTQL